ncbi:hypothetical protein EBAPG3_010900 [Nitrosospira lacus]|uniref:LamG-like jellyroll fold domain-containing protein n=1 Tax=Nitrosospira lacus TaxID=1288494 RepID=A0A1W6SR10_9PROT|nr:LamG domain-containing protein [Nitrosospira lacus]ARO88247.1 hypothetical protein EBAPG3_010900 [Nitrosospira lacus]
MPIKYSRTIAHSGTVIAFSIVVEADLAPQMVYSVHVMENDNVDSDSSWSEPRNLQFPKEICTLGRGLLVVKMSEAAPMSDAGFDVMSDAEFIYVFRPSTNQTIYCDKFVLDQTTGKLTNAVQVRYRRSRKAYLPMDRRDSFGARDMNEVFFVEPTTELDFADGVVPGRFCVTLLPTELAGISKWQMLCQNAQTGKLDSYSIARSQNGGFDLGDSLDPDSGAIIPNASFELVDANGAALSLESGPAICRYDQQEWQLDEYGKINLQKREVRVMVALAVGSARQIAYLDFGLGKDGMLAQVGNKLTVADKAVLQGALNFCPEIAAQVDLPSIATGPTMTFETWLLPSKNPEGACIIAASAASEAVLFTLGLDGGIPYFIGPDGHTVAGTDAISNHDWTHVAAVWDASCTLYINGQAYTTDNGVEGENAEAPASGYRLGGEQGFTGDLAAVRLWNSVRSQEQIWAGMNTIITDQDPDWPHLLGAWQMNEPNDARRFTTVPNQSQAGAANDGVLAGARWVASRVPSTNTGVALAIDPRGLTFLSGMLAYAATDATPSIDEGADSLLHLYYAEKGSQQACAAHFCPVVTRASYLVPWIAADASTPENSESGQLSFVARMAGTAMNNKNTKQVWIKIVKKPKQKCQVTLSSYTGYTEVWPGVPQAVDEFVQVINGQAAQLSNDPAEIDEDQLMYDYTKVTITPGYGQSGPAPAAGTGSSIFVVFIDAEPANGMAALVQETSDTAPPARGRIGAGGRWLPYAPLLGLDMQDLGQYIEIISPNEMVDYQGSLLLDRDMTIEAWLNPLSNEMDNVHTVFVFNKNGKTKEQTVRYILGLNDGRPFAGKGEVINVASEKVPLDQGWSHLAASYRTSFGLQLGGSRYLNAGSDESLNTAEAVTVEAWVRLDALGAEQVVIAKTGTGTDSSWSLAIDSKGKLVFRVNQSTETGTYERAVTSRSALSIGSWTHVAGVYDVAFERQVAIAFDQKSYVKIPQVGTPPKTGVSVMMWLKRTQNSSNTEEVMFSSTDAAASLVFTLSLYKGVPQFTVYVDDGTYSIKDSATLRRDDWVHIAGTYDPVRGIALIIDGVPILPMTGVAERVGSRRTLTSTGVSLLGLQAAKAAQGEAEAAYSVGGIAAQLSFIGTMNEVSLWDRGLSLNEVRQKILQPLASNERGLAGYWKFNDLFGNTVMDLAGTANGSLVTGNFIRIDKGAFAHKLFINGSMEAFERVVDPIAISNSSLTMGSSVFTKYLQGAVSESRLWKVGRMNWQIDYFRTEPLEPNAKGLLANWPFRTGKGGTVFDDKSNNNALIRDGRVDLTDEIMDAMWIQTAFKSGWSFFINGDPINSMPGALPSGDYGSEQANLGAFSLRGSISRFFTGQISQTRIWSTQRTGAQIRGAMFTLLSGKEPGMAAFWAINNGSGQYITDYSGWGNTGIANDDAVWLISTAPAGLEEPALQSTPGDIAKPENLKTAFAPTVGRYGQTQVDARGNLYASLLQTLAIVDQLDASMVLFADFRIGNLILQYIGQAQVEPTLIGYIEGAPPLPAENMKLFPGDPLSYVGASSVLIDETDIKTYSYTASRDRSTVMDMNVRYGFAVEGETSAGIGVQQQILAYGFNAGLALQTDSSVGILGEGLASEELTVTARKFLESRGEWKPNVYQIDAGVGDIHYPNNVGYALVRSGTADLFAMRIEGTGTLVGYTSRPNPDIPEDMNIIMFKLNDQYVKNGTLDGWIGFQPDKSYPNLQVGDQASYFKPLEAYAMKASIEREQKQRESRFENFDAEALGQRANILSPRGTDIADSSQSLVNALIGLRQKAALSVKEWRAQMARRSMVNTYVWTALGGLYAEQQQFMALREESSGGTFSISTKAGFYTEATLSVGPTFSLDAMFGTSITTQSMKTDHDSAMFTLEIDLPGDQRYIGLIEEDPDEDYRYTNKPSPGKVQGYRFMSFYRSPSKQNFEKFSEVIDQNWLYGQGEYAGKYDPDALALRSALHNPNEVWRVLYRVTYVNRTPPSVQDKGQTIAANVQLPDEDSVLSNAVMIAELPTDLNAQNPMARVSIEADELLARLSKNPVWGADLLKKKAEYKEDIMRYMRSYYRIPS